MRGSIAILSILAIAPFAGAQTFDRVKFRQAIELPAIDPRFGINLKVQERDARGNKFEPMQKIADLQKKLTGGPDDAQVYLDQRDVYLDPLKDVKKSEELARKAEAVLRPHMQTTDAKQAYLLTLYGTCMEILVEDHAADCEKWARRAVQIGPDDWRTWAYLARARHQQIPAILCGGSDKDLPKDRRTQEVIGSLYLQRYQPEHVNAAEKALDEALQYHDKARTLAPNEPRRAELRYAFRLTEIVLRNGIAASRSKPQPYPLMHFERLAVDELQTAARLLPEHLVWQSQLAQQLIILGWRESKEKAGNAREFRPARPDDQQAIREALARIEKLADGAAAAETKVCCHTVLATLNLAMLDHAAVEKHARKVLTADPKHRSAWELLHQTLMQLDRKADVLQEAQAYAEKVPSARSCFVLARALASNGRHDQAEQMCRAGLKFDATDVHCLLGLTCLLMRRADDAASLEAAGTLIKLAKDGTAPDAGADIFDELEYVAAIHQALTGEADFARLKLQRQQRERPENPRCERLLNVIGR